MAAMLAEDGPRPDRDLLRLVVAGCHHNGRLRQAAVAHLARTNHPAAVAVVALRTADWVPQVRVAARRASLRWLAPAADPIHLVSAAGLAFALRARREGAWLADRVERTLPELPQAALCQLLSARDRHTGRIAHQGCEPWPRRRSPALAGIPLSSTAE